MSSSSTKPAFPQTIDVIKTRAGYFGYEVVLGKPEDAARHDCSAPCCNTRMRAARSPT
jgi:glycine cleavage system pyridoxal-binding protein P